MSKSYSVGYIFQNFKTSLKLSYDQIYERFTIRIEDEEETDYCLTIVLYDTSSPIECIAEIENLTMEINCPIPKVRGGTWIMQLVDDLMCHLNVKHLTLVDLATIRCPTNNHEVNLAMLRIYGGSKSWYENFGYFSSTAHYNQAILEYISSPISDLQTILESPLHEPKLKSLENLRKSAHETMSLYPPVKNQSLGEYMTLLWNRDCREYLNVENFLRESSHDFVQQYKIFPWTRARWILETSKTFGKTTVC